MHIGNFFSARDCHWAVNLFVVIAWASILIIGSHKLSKPIMIFAGMCIGANITYLLEKINDKTT